MSSYCKTFASGTKGFTKEVKEVKWVAPQVIKFVVRFTNHVPFVIQDFVELSKYRHSGVSCVALYKPEISMVNKIGVHLSTFCKFKNTALKKNKYKTMGGKN